jgi:hypothetical protein
MTKAISGKLTKEQAVNMIITELNYKTRTDLRNRFILGTFAGIGITLILAWWVG